MMSPEFNPALAGPEHVAAAPGIAETFEMDNPGMHTTPTVDYACVIDGEIVLELDDGVTVQLKRAIRLSSRAHAMRGAIRATNPPRLPSSCWARLGRDVLNV